MIKTILTLLITTLYLSASATELPEGWNKEEIIEAALAYDSKNKGIKIESSEIVAWGSFVDDRPLYLDICYIVGNLKKEKWFISMVFRHPKSKFNKWALSSTSYQLDDGCSWEIDYREYDYPPSDEDIEFFIKCTNHFAQDFNVIKEYGLNPNKASERNSEPLRSQNPSS